MHVSYRAPISISITLLTVCVWFSPYATPLLTTVCFALSAQFDLCLFGFCFVYCALCAVVPLYFQHTNKNIIQKKNTNYYIYFYLHWKNLCNLENAKFVWNERKERNNNFCVCNNLIFRNNWVKQNKFLFVYIWEQKHFSLLLLLFLFVIVQFFNEKKTTKITINTFAFAFELMMVVRFFNTLYTHSRTNT